MPLRLCGAINGLSRSGKAQKIAAIYPPHHPPQLDEKFWQVLDAAVHSNQDQILTQLEWAPQTNEVRRASALMPALLGLVQQFELPIKLYEMGASAGLNLALDHFGYQLGDQYYGPADAPFTLHPDWQGPTPPHADIQITSRQGCDLNPLNVQRADDAERLMSYIWPDQIERVERTKRAIALVNDLEINLAKQDATTWLKSALKACEKGYIHVVFNTVAFQYFPPEAQQDIRDIMAKAGAAATAMKPLVWLQLEVDGGTPGFAITQRVWPGEKTCELGRADAMGNGSLGITLQNSLNSNKLTFKN